MVFNLNFLVIGMGLIVMAILGFAHRGPRHPKVLLILYFGLFTAILIHVSLLLTGRILQVPHLYRVSSPLSYMVGATSFLYVRAVLFQEKKFRKHDYLHLAPLVLHTIELLPLYLMPRAAKVDMLTTLVRDPERFSEATEGILPPYFHLSLKALLMIAYMAVALYLLWKYRRKQRKDNGLPGQPAAVITWLAYFTCGNLLIGLAVFTSALLGRSAPGDSQTLIYFFIGSLVLVVLLILLFRPYILYGLPANWATTNSRANTPSTLLKEDQLEEYKQQLLRYMEEKKPFLRPDLSLNQLADLTRISRHHLSACINEGFQVNFNEFINRYRIRYICEEADPAIWHKFSISGLAEEAGFNSRFTFNRAFKKETGMTPGEYRKRLD